MTDYDSPWKEMLQGYFPAFIEFFFPNMYQDIDWSRGYESLDKELQRIVRDAKLGRRLADKLIKVWRRNGEEQIVLIHIEVQGEAEVVFAKRIYVYNYRLFDRYDCAVVSLAVLCDTSPNWRPNHYIHNLWGCRVGIEFPVAKLRDYNAQWSALEQNDNPFAIVVMAHLKTQATQKNPEDRLRWKTHLVRQLYQRGYQRKEVLELLRFIDWVLVLPEGLEDLFQIELEHLEVETKMRYVTSFERRGIKKGIEQGKALMLKRLLIRRFGPLPNWAEQRLTQANQQELENWADQVLDARHLDDIFEAE